MRLIRSILPTLAIAIISAPSGFAQNMITEPLKGVTTVSVTVDLIKPDVASAGVDTSGIRSLVELRLRQQGLRVTDKIGPSVDGIVNVNLIAMQIGTTGIWAYHIELEFAQPARFLRPSAAKLQPAVVDSWSKSYLGYTPSGELDGQVREKLGKELDGFLSDFLSVNPPAR